MALCNATQRTDGGRQSYPYGGPEFDAICLARCLTLMLPIRLANIEGIIGMRRGYPRVGNKPSARGSVGRSGSGQSATVAEQAGREVK